MTYIIRHRAANKIRQYYRNVATKFRNTYSIELLLKNIDDALNAILQIENGLPRRNPSLNRWTGLYMASYMVKGKTRWNYAYRIEGDIIYVEDACHAQNMSDFSSSTSTVSPSSAAKQYQRTTRKPLFGYRFVRHRVTKKYNLINNEGKLLTDWFDDIRPCDKPIGQYQVIAYINRGGMVYALCANGYAHPLQRMWKDMYGEAKTPHPLLENRKQIIRLTETQFMNMLTECISEIIRKIA